MPVLLPYGNMGTDLSENYLFISFFALAAIDILFYLECRVINMNKDNVPLSENSYLNEFPY